MSRSPSEIIISELTRIRATLETLEQQDSSSKQAFNALYEEMETYKQQSFFDLERGFLLDLLFFYDGLHWSLSEAPEDTQNQVKEDFLELLSRRDVVPMPEMTHFDAKIHRVLQIVPTDDPNLDGTIAQVLKKGFFRGTQVLRIEDISMYQVPQS
jgi:molecular chaperone GrpE (heat shock protein)